MDWGGGTDNVDTRLRRSAANVLSMGANQSFRIEGDTSDPGSPEAGQIFYRSDTDKLKWYDGAEWRQPHITDKISIVAGTAVANTLTKTTMDSYALLADRIEDKTNLRFTCRGKGTAFTGTPTVTFTIEAGANTYITLTTPALPSGQWFYKIEADLTCRVVGASGTIYAAAEMTYADSAGTVRTAMDHAGSAVAVDTPAALTFNLSGQWSAASANNRITNQQFIMEQLN